MALQLNKTRAGLDASIDGRIDVRIETKKKYRTFCIMFNELNASSGSTLGHYWLDALNGEDENGSLALISHRASRL